MCMNLKPNHAITISVDEMAEAARGELRSLLFNSLRQDDIDKFIQKIEQNWDISVFHDLMKNTYTIRPVNQPSQHYRVALSAGKSALILKTLRF